ncbi:MAG: FemAB family PEP-CTERM system-associated protein, partial [Nitrococcus mobilis]|nr:FemAB family PEP-CTERM system-associated protein [Nitrococcus mobilis]
MPAVAVERTESTTVRITELTAQDIARWDAFVDVCPGATFFHRAGWKEVIERAFGHSTYFLMAENGDAIEGVLPLARLRSRLFGDALISLPFAVYGGIAASTEPAADALDKAAQVLAERLGVGHLEYRHCKPMHSDWPTKDLYVTFRGRITPDSQANMAAIPRKQRAMVRKGMRAGLQSRFDDDNDRFFQAYSYSVHQLGTPVFARRYFDLLREVFGRSCDVLTVSHGERLVASVLSFYFRDEVLPFYGGGTSLARELAGNDFMYWQLMESARERGYRLFDFGRSKRGAGSYHFKKHWGFEPQPLHYECRLIRATALPDNSPMNPKYRLFIAL